MVILFVVTSFLTAALLFLVQPMVGRMVLPAFGGSPQVWTTSMLFFQVALLVGYGYTHLTTTRLHRRVQPWVHLGVAALPVLLLPIALTVVPSGGGGIRPSIELLSGLTLGVAAPFVLVATSGPLIQRWFSWTSHPQSHDPYFLYSAGNVGSAAGLLGYPFILEPAMSIESQSRLWALGYVTAVVLLAACAIVVRQVRRPDAPDPHGRSGTGPWGDASGKAPLYDPVTTKSVERRRTARWILLSFIPSSLMLAVTSLISTDIAAAPLLWIVPLGTYLLTFTVAFSGWGPTALRWGTAITPVVVLAAVSIRSAGSPILIALAVQVLLVLVGGIVAHGLLAADRPPAHQLTRFYLLVAVGGALGGVFNSLIAPLVFPTVFEYGITVALLAGLVVRWREPITGAANWHPAFRLSAMLLLVVVPLIWYVLFATSLFAIATPGRILIAVLVAIPLLTALRTSAALGMGIVLIALAPQVLPLVHSDVVERTFFGIHRVVSDGDSRWLVHGTTVHGTQDTSSYEARRTAVSYYHPDQPFGDIMRLVDGEPSVGVLGLGAGGIAAYGEAGQTLTFHEIDPAVVEIARTWFTFLKDTPAEVDVVVGDGRLTIGESDVPYGLLVMDAFTSDAVPVHLLTVEAFESYLDRLDADGLIAVNISNRYLDLRPVLAAIVAELDLDGVYAYGDGAPDGATPSQWVAIARSAATLDQLRSQGWNELPAEQVLWTDQRSSLFSVLVR
jgi:hypothetical protein